MKDIVIIFICFILSLCIVMYNDNGDVLNSYEESAYVFKDNNDNKENISNPITDDIELDTSIVILFYSFLFTLMFGIKLNICDRYILD